MNNFTDQARAGAPLGAPEHRPRLVLRFAVHTGAVLLAAGLAIAWLVTREVADRAERTVQNQARVVAETSLRSQIRTSDFVRPVSPARRATLDRLFRRSVLIPGVVGGRLVSRGGTITYAARHSLIGVRARQLDDLRRILAGDVDRRVMHTTSWRGEQNLKVLRVRVPVRVSGSAHAIGALELDQDYRVVGVTVDDARDRLALILALALLALYASLFPILRRVTLELERRNRRLHEHAAEREHLLEAERAARADAEAMQRRLAAQNERLVELDALKDEFVSLVSHELRTPLTSIRGYVELLLGDEALGDEHRRYLSVVERNSERLLDLVSDLLFLAQVDAGRLSLELAPVDLEELVRECAENSLPAATAKQIELEVGTEHVAVLRGDRGRLAQVLDNLVSNAIKFTPDGGRVSVRLRPEGGVAVLEVEDTGLGLGEEEQAQLFERFFRSSRAAENAIPGTGLGLAIAKTIVEHHGGRIGIDSIEDVGTTVHVELPLSEHGLERTTTRELAA